MSNTSWKLDKMYDPDHSCYIPCVILSVESDELKGVYSIPISEGLAESLAKAYFTHEANTIRDIWIEGPIVEGSVL